MTASNHSTTLTLPPIEVLGQAAFELAAHAEGTGAEKSINKAIYHLSLGIAIVPTTGGFLIPSANTREVYRVSTVHGCSCKGYLNHGHCYHDKMIQIVEHAQMRALPPVVSLGERIALQRRAQAELDELYAA